MTSREDLESYLVRVGLPFEELGEGLWVVHEGGNAATNIVVSYSTAVTVFRVKLMDLPEGDNAGLFRKLLELNATEMLSGAYGIEEDSIVAVETMPSENLDFNEFQAAIDALTVAMTEHYDVLNAYRGTSA